MASWPIDNKINLSQAKEMLFSDHSIFVDFFLFFCCCFARAWAANQWIGANTRYELRIHNTHMANALPMQLLAHKTKTANKYIDAIEIKEKTNEKERECTWRMDNVISKTQDSIIRSFEGEIKFLFHWMAAQPIESMYIISMQTSHIDVCAQNIFIVRFTLLVDTTTWNMLAKNAIVLLGNHRVSWKTN